MADFDLGGHNPFETWQREVRNAGSKRWKRWLGGGLSVLLLAGAVLSGIYIVPAGSRAVLFRLGRVVGVEDQGLHFKVPLLETAEIVNTERLRRFEFGYRTREVGPPARYEDEPLESKMLTSDNKIVEVNWVLQFQIADPALYVTRVPDGEPAAEKFIRDMAESVVRKILASRTMDEVLTTGKEEIQTKARQDVQKVLEELQTGVRVVAVQLQDVNPPAAVQGAFSEVNSARAEKERLQLEAQQFANELIPQAEGEAQRLTNEAEAYRFRVVQVAQGEVSRIRALAPMYAQNPQLVKNTLWLEGMKDVWPQLKVAIMDAPNGSSGAQSFLMLDVNGLLKQLEGRGSERGH